ncbi:aquaporin [Auricularia subglabra TFB-10046 SS5]|nr:aquaporin [Auricularia subglabra TFB-10046 SS5]
MSLFSEWKIDLIAAAFEFLGTSVFLILGLGAAQSVSYLNTTIDPSAAASNTADFMYISAGFGLALLVAAWIFFRISGALFNPNISTALLLLRVIKPFRYVLYVVAQLTGGICAAAIIRGLMPDPLAVNTLPNPRVNHAQALLVEMFVTSFLTLAVLMLAVEKHCVTPFAPVGIGITLFICELWSVPLTGGSLNTARSFGPAVVTHFDDSHWVYWLGPTLGAVLASVVYICIKGSHYWHLAPDQDATDYHKSPHICRRHAPAESRDSPATRPDASDASALSKAEKGQSAQSNTAIQNI